MNRSAKLITAERALEMMPSGVFLPPNATHSSDRVLIVAVQHSNDDILELVNKSAMMQLHYPYVKPVFLISAQNPGELTRAGFIYETVMPESAWGMVLGMEASHREYMERRVHEMISVYIVSRVAEILPGQEIPRWLYER